MFGKIALGVVGIITTGLKEYLEKEREKVILVSTEVSFTNYKN